MPAPYHTITRRQAQRQTVGMSRAHTCASQACSRPLRFASASLPISDRNRDGGCTQLSPACAGIAGTVLRFEVPARIALPGEGWRRLRCDLRPCTAGNRRSGLYACGTACVLWRSRLAPARRMRRTCLWEPSNNSKRRRSGQQSGGEIYPLPAFVAVYAANILRRGGFAAIEEML